MFLLTHLWIVIPLYFAYRRLSQDYEAHKKKLADEATRKEYIEKLVHPRFQIIYAAILRKALNIVDRIFGRANLQLKGFAFCAAVSFLYSLFGFILAWAAGGPGTIGKTALMPDDWPLNLRIEYTILLIVTCVLMYIFTCYPHAILLWFQRNIRRNINLSLSAQKNVTRGVVILCAIALYTVTRSMVYPVIFLVTYLFLNIALTVTLFIGGATCGIVAALFSGLYIQGSHRFVPAIAILAAVAFGGSFGARPFAATISRYYRRCFRGTAHYKSIVEKISFALVFAVIGATGGAALVTAAAKTYSIVVGPEIDNTLQLQIGFSSSSEIFPIIGLISGFIGGLSARLLGAGGVVIGSFLCGLLVLAALGFAFASEHPLHYYFGSTSSFLAVVLINMLLFFMILPVTNAVWDWLSWEASRRFGRQLLKKVTNVRILVHVAAVFFIGGVLLVGLTGSASWEISQFNKWMLANTGTAPLPIDALVSNAAENPWSPQGMWVTMMLLSTLFPAVCHFLFITFGVLLFWAPQGFRMKLADAIAKNNRPSDLNRAALYFTVLPIIGLVIVGLFVAVTFLILTLLGSPVSEMLRAIAEWAGA